MKHEKAPTAPFSTICRWPIIRAYNQVSYDLPFKSYSPYKLIFRKTVVFGHFGQSRPFPVAECSRNCQKAYLHIETFQLSLFPSLYDLQFAGSSPYKKAITGGHPNSICPHKIEWIVLYYDARFDYRFKRNSKHTNSRRHFKFYGLKIEVPGSTKLKLEQAFIHILYFLFLTLNQTSTTNGIKFLARTISYFWHSLILENFAKSAAEVGRRSWSTPSTGISTLRNPPL